MVLEACNDAIQAAIGRELSDREKAAISRRALELKRKIDLAGNDPLAVNSVLGQFAKDVATQQALKRRNAAINFRIGQEKDAYRKGVDFAKAAPDEVARGMFVQSQKNYFGAKASLGTAVGREAHARTSAFTADLIKSNLFDYAFKSGDDKNIWMARAALNDPNADPAQIASQYGKDAVAVAQIMAKHQEAARADQNLAGAWINRNPDYVTGQTHEPYLLARAGGNKFGSNESFQQWQSDIGSKLDWNKSFDGELSNSTPAERLKRLQSVWNQFVAGKHLSWQDQGFGVGSQNLAKRASQERQLVFQSPEAQHDYWQGYGKQGSLAESVWHDLERAGRNIAVMREWGPNAQMNINKFFDRWSKEINETGDAKQFAALTKAQKRVETQYLPTLLDMVGHPDSNFVAHYLSMARQTLLMAKIGASLPSNIGDIILKASYAQRYNDKTVGNFMGELFKSAGRVISSVPEADRQTIAKEYAIRLENAITPMGMEYHEIAGTGKLARWNQMVMKTFGHSWWSNGFRTSSLAADGFRHFSQAAKTFDQLPEGMRDLMQQFGMDSRHWDIIRKSDPLELADGTKIFSPSQVRQMDPGEFKDIANGDGDAALKRARDQVADRYRNMMGELADTTTSAPNRNMRAIINGPVVNSPPWVQELYRGFFGLKGFVSNYMRNHLGGIAMGQDANPANVGWAKAMARTFSGQNGASSAKLMASLIAGGVGFGYVRDFLKDIVDGKTPQNPVGDHAGDAMRRAFLFQSFGLLSDFVLASSGRPDDGVWDKIGGLMGPEISTAGDFVDDISRTGNHLGKWAFDHDYSNDDFYRDFGKDAGNWTSDIYHSIPGNNLLWTKAATDHFVLAPLMEQMNPGYEKRIQDRMRKNSGQSLILGGGNGQ